MKTIALLFAFMAATTATTATTATAATTIDAECVARGKYGRSGGGIVTNSELSFRLSGDAESATIRSVRGTVKVAYNYEGDTPDTLNESNAYIGYFQTARIENNPGYRPRRYKNYFQFQKLNAVRTTGHESGMWGDLVVEKTAFLRGTDAFQAHYIFQAGDHMGGTIHFKCTKE
ncbi:MAG: hypothetical protein HUU37_05085 [Bdellovibrionales bacterium]|nr:hypothetical protein [Bdellovibrionales bacterium]